MTTKKVTPEQLREMLKEGKVTFKFEKKNGEIRTAVGTLKNDLITKETFGCTNFAKEAGYKIYFDVEKGNFRCYNPDKLIGVVEA